MSAINNRGSARSHSLQRNLGNISPGEETGNSGEVSQGTRNLGGKFVETGVSSGNTFTHGGIKAKLHGGIKAKLTGLATRVVEEVEKRFPSLASKQVYGQNDRAVYAKKVSEVSKVFSRVSEILKNAKEGVKKAGEEVSSYIKDKGEGFKKNLKETKNYKDLKRIQDGLEDYVKNMNTYLDGVVNKKIRDIEEKVRKELAENKQKQGEDISEVSSAKVFSQRFTAESDVFRGIVNALLKEASTYIEGVSTKIDTLDKDVRGNINGTWKGIGDKVSTSLREASSRVKKEGEKLREKVANISVNLQPGNSFEEFTYFDESPPDFRERSVRFKLLEKEILPNESIFNAEGSSLDSDSID